MILIILGIALAMFITGAVLFDKCDNDIVVGGLTITGGVVGVGAVIVAIVMLCCVIDSSVIDEKIPFMKKLIPRLKHILIILLQITNHMKMIHMKNSMVLMALKL